MSRLDKELSRLYVYASMLSDRTPALSGPQGMQQEMQQLFAKFGAEAAFVEPEILKVAKATVEKAIAAEPRLKTYAFYLNDIFRRAAHTLSDAEEKLLADAGPLAGSPNNIYDPDQRRLPVSDDHAQRRKDGEGRSGRLQRSAHVARSRRSSSGDVGVLRRARRLQPHDGHDDELERAAVAVLLAGAKVSSNLEAA